MGNEARKEFHQSLVPDHCEIPDCGYKIHVTRHRIKPGRIGGRYIPGNVIGLCPNCHIEAELGMFRQYDLFEIVHNRLRKRFERVREV